MHTTEAIQGMGKTKKPRREVRRVDRVEPTPETLAKLKPDPLLRLEPDYQRAALEIERAYLLITAPVAERIADLDSVRATRSEWTGAQSALIERYCDWVERLGKANSAHRLAGKPGRFRVSLVLDMIVDRSFGPMDMLLRALDFWLDNRDRKVDKVGSIATTYRKSPAGNRIRAGVVVSVVS